MDLPRHLFGGDEQATDAELSSKRDHRTHDWEADRRGAAMVNAGLRAWEEDDLKAAERYLRAGVAAYRAGGDHETDYALGRLGDFFVKQDRLEEAAEILEEALERGTTISAVYGDYRILMWRKKERGEWDAEQSKRAEAALRAGFRAAEHRGPPHQTVAFNALAGFLLNEDRPEDAEREIHAALAIVPNDPDLLRSLWRAMYLKRDSSGVVETVLREFRVRNQPSGGWPELCELADSTVRGGEPEFAEELARRFVERAQSDGNTEVRWLAVGALGRVIERTDRVSEAIEMWQSAFEQGSRDPLTVNRLSMHLERQRKLLGAIAVIKQALEQPLPSDVENQLRKRLERCQARLEKRARRDVPAFSARTGEHEMRLLSQARVSPSVRKLHTVGAIGRSWSLRRNAGVWTKWAIETASVLERRDDLPRLRTIEFAADGYAIGAAQTGPVDECVTDLGFLSPDGDLVGTNQLPNGFSQISCHSDGSWLVGCRDGGLYAYSVLGEHLWTWRVPGSENHGGDRYLRPCPFVVAADSGGTLIASFGSVHRITHDGERQWSFNLAAQVLRTSELSVGPAPPSAYAELGLPISAQAETVKAAYRQRAMATHPDRNPHLIGAAEQFQRVHRAYEAIMAADQTDLPDVDIRTSFDLMPRSVTSLLASGSLAHVATVNGLLYTLDAEGSVIDVRSLGEGRVVTYADAEQRLVAAWCDDQLFYFDGLTPLTLAAHRWVPDGAGAFGEGLYVWSGKRVGVLDLSGREIWAAEFPTTINAVAADEDRLVVAGSVVATFRRNGA